jgi:hypothetical protein
MKVRLVLLILVSCSCSWAQINNGGGGSSGTIPTSLVQSGLIAEYRLTEGSGTTITDFSGNGNTGTFGAAGAAPTWVSGTGGLSFNGGQYVTLPVAVSNPHTVMVFFTSVLTIAEGSNDFPLIGAADSSSAIMLQNFGNTGLGVNSYAGLLSGARITTFAGGAYVTITRNAWNGTGLLTYVLDATTDVVYINGQLASNTYVAGGTYNRATAAYLLGGSSGSLNYLVGKIYYAAFYNRELTSAEVAANSQYIANAVAARGVTGQMSPDLGHTNSVLVADGDSITVGYNGLVPYTGGPFTLTNASQWRINNTGQSGATFSGANPLETYAQFSVDPLYHPGSYQNVVIIWAGSNDVNGLSASAVMGGLTQYCKDRHTKGWKVIAATMVSRSGQDANKNTYNTLIRQNWSTFADGLADIAADPLLGADGASASATYFQTGVHPTQTAIYNSEVPVFQRAVNRLYGNTSWTSANTYTTAAPAATSITASSESGNTATITSTLNPPVGSTVTIAGVTPAGYNGSYVVQTTSASTFTVYLPVTGLGAGSVFGTAQIPLQVDGDVYVVLGGSAAGNPAFTMQSCVGYTGQNLYFKNTNTTSAWALTPFGSETIDGAATLTMPTASSGNNPVVILQSVLVSASAAGCNWKRLQ